jgi:hypothetical protein
MLTITLPPHDRKAAATATATAAICKRPRCNAKSCKHQCALHGMTSGLRPTTCHSTAQHSPCEAHCTTSLPHLRHCLPLDGRAVPQTTCGVQCTLNLATPYQTAQHKTSSTSCTTFTTSTPPQKHVQVNDIPATMSSTPLPAQSVMSPPVCQRQQHQHVSRPTQPYPACKLPSMQTN